MRLIDADYLYNKLVANKCPYDLVLQMVKDEPTVDVLDKIRAEIEKPLRVERYADTENAKAQAIALSWCLEIINKYMK